CDASREGKILGAREEERNGVLGVGPGETAEKDLSWLELTSVDDISEDGKLLLLKEEGEAAGPNGALIVRKMDGSAPMRLGEGSGQLSPDGKHVLTTVPGSRGPLKILSVGPGEPTIVKTDGLELLDVAWLPDNHRVLLYGREPGQPPRMLLVDADTGARRPIVLEGAPATSFGVTPDSRRILAHRSDGTWAFYPIEGGSPAPVEGILPGEEPVRFSRDGLTL